VSNHPKLRPPAAVLAAARAYRCGHCRSRTGNPKRDHSGIWHIGIHHDQTCPVLAGTISRAPAGIRSAQSAAGSTGQRILYISQATP
jgi:hypothetical protein